MAACSILKIQWSYSACFRVGRQRFPGTHVFSVAGAANEISEMEHLSGWLNFIQDDADVHVFLVDDGFDLARKLASDFQTAQQMAH